jgi:hypothetical protein
VEPFAEMFRNNLAALGWVDGKNVRLDFRLAEGDTGRLPELAEALVREEVNVIFAAGPARRVRLIMRPARSRLSQPPVISLPSG